MNKMALFLIGLMAFTGAAWGVDQEAGLLTWKQLASLPPDAGRVGAFVGVSDGALIVAGGQHQSKDGKTTPTLSDAVYVLESPESAWKLAGRLPHPLTGGVAISTAKGLVCAGGINQSVPVAEVLRLSWDGRTLYQNALPPLPRPAAYACGALLKDTLFIMGGEERAGVQQNIRHFWALDLSQPDQRWQALEPWPGADRMLAIAAAQDGAIFLCGGLSLEPDGLFTDVNGVVCLKTLQDAWRFTPGSGWSRITDSWSPVTGGSTPAPVIGPTHFLVLGGGDSIAYHTITRTWTNVKTPGPANLSEAAAAIWRGGFAAVSPYDGSVWHATPVSRKADFGFLNYATLVLYLLGMVGIGWACMRLNRNTEDFFRGSQKIPWWAAGLSIFATMLSSITFMAIPAKAYATDWVFMLANLPILLLCPIVIRLYLPFYRRLDATSAYEYLEKRFNLPVRLFGAAAFVLYHVGRVAVVLYLPAIALATVTSLNVSACIAIMGVLSVLYCVMGGIQAVIWTDVAQTVVLLGGALFSLALILWRVFDPADGFGPLFAMANEAGKFHMADWSWDATTATIWVVLLGNLFSNLAPFTADQAVVQRYMTTPDEKAAARAIWINGIMTIPTTVLFFAVGTALFLFYKLNPERLDPTLQTDAIFPLFISRELPPGVAGLVVAGIFAAAQSTIAASIHSSSTVIVTDFVRRLRRRGPAAGGDLGLARGLTGVLGVFGTGLALMLADAGVKSLWDIFLQLLGLVGGSLAGLFVLGIFTRRANGPGALIGAISGAVALCLVQRHTPIHFFLYAAIGILTCCAVGYAASLFFGGAGKPLQGLTIYTLNERTRPQSEPEPLPAKSEI